jgi:DNA-binding MarR family transcriptional regulator
MDENSVTTEDRAVLRAVAAYTGNVTAADVARLAGISRQSAAGTLARLAQDGLLSRRTGQGARSAYDVTSAGRAELERNRTTCLLVEVDGRLASEIAVYLQSVNGVEMAYEHGNGCCCQHCPHKGNCR